MTPRFLEELLHVGDTAEIQAPSRAESEDGTPDRQ